MRERLTLPWPLERHHGPSLAIYGASQRQKRQLIGSIRRRRLWATRSTRSPNGGGVLWGSQLPARL